MSLVSSKLNAIYNRLLNNELVVKHLKIKKIVALPKKATVPKKPKQKTINEKKKIAEMKKILKAEENERKIIKRLLAVRD